MNDIVTRYLACWNETDAVARRRVLDELFAPGATYVDPMVDVHGVDEIDATIAAVHQMFPGFVFRPVGSPDAHHDQVRFGWSLGPDGAEPPVLGFDVVVTDADGRITSVLGFLDRAPAAA